MASFEVNRQSRQQDKLSPQNLEREENRVNHRRRSVYLKKKLQEP